MQSSKPTPSPRIVEPWHLRCGNPSLPTHILRAKEDKNPSPVQGRETFIPALGLDIQQTGSRQESAAVIAQDGCQWVRAGRHFVLVALLEAGLDCGFSSGAVCSLLSKGSFSLLEPEPQDTVGRVFWNQTRHLCSKSAPPK